MGMGEGNSALGAAPANNRGLLALVITLGALILLALGMLVGGALLGAGPGAGDAEAYQTAIPAAGDAHIAGAELDGTRLMLRIDGGDEGGSVVVIEAATGRVVGRIELDRAP
jgi:hypothetical protein